MNINEWLGDDIPEETIQQAVEWVATFDDCQSDSQSETKRLAFYEWLAEDNAHQQAFAEVSELWARTSCLQSFKSKIENSQVISFPKKNQQQPTWPVQPLLSDSMMCSMSFSPSWLYEVTIVTICVGFLLPFVL